jgi:hypothetical protein
MITLNTCSLRELKDALEEAKASGDINAIRAATEALADAESEIEDELATHY